MAAKSPEVLVIGAGPGGYVAGIRLAQLGKEVLVIDRKWIGGVCLNVGCIPVKALLHAGGALKGVERAQLMGLKPGEVEVDLKLLNEWKVRIVDRLVKGIESLFKSNGVDYRKAEARFTDSETVLLSGDGGEETLKPRSVIVATGSEPITLPGFEPDGELVVTSDEAIRFESIPERLLVIGAGAVGLEFAALYSLFGSKVTVIEVLDQVLPETDSEVSRALGRALTRQGIEIHLRTKPLGVERGGPVVVTILENGEESTLEVDKILVSVGRKASTEGLGLEVAGVSRTENGFIQVDEQRRALIPHIYAIGDITGPPLLAHKAMREGVVAAESVAGLPSTFEPKAIPNCVFTQPEVATVGLSEEEARNRGYEVAVGRFPLAASGKALVLGDTGGLVKTVADKKTDLLLGLHLLSPEASSLIGEGVLAIEAGVTAEDLALAIHPHPTLSEAVMEAAANLHRKAIHISNR